MPANSDKSCVSVEQEDAGRSCFTLGSLFATRIVGGGSDTTKVCIPKGVSLTITTATCRGQKRTELYITTDTVDSFPVCILRPDEAVAGLDLLLVGPQSIHLGASSKGSTIHVVGSITPSTYEYTKSMSVREEEVHEEQTPSTASKVGAESSTTKKRKLSDAQATEALSSTDEKHDDNVSTHQDQEKGEPTQQVLSKRQRKKLAKKKAKELAEAVAFLNKHESKVDSSANNKNESKKTVSLTKERRLPSGVYVKDIIVGSGPEVKLGRMVSILYEASFPNGKVFDKSKNRNKPFTFRQGTGEVIKGLEKGILGMKVGGEREVTIPPEQGYGKKGSGPVPPNSTLVFSVQLVGIGG